MKTKLQVVLDDITLDESLLLLDKIQNYIDIVEVGTPFMMQYGMKVVGIIKKQFPDILLLCDTKIMDKGSYEAQLTFDAGVDYVTVLGITDILTIKECVIAAQNNNRKVMVDMICVDNLKEKIEMLESLGVDVIAVHTEVDQQSVGRTPLDDVKVIREYVKGTAIAVAGGINLNTIDDYLKYHPEIIIIGSGITKAENPVLITKHLKERLG